MRPIRAAINFTTNAVKTAIGLLGRVRDAATGRDDDELWTAEEEATPAKAAAKASSGKKAASKTTASRKDVAAKARSNGAKTTDDAKAATAVALKERPSLAERLESVQGIGPAKREAILEVYKTEDELLATDVNTLAEIDGISVRLAKQILDGLR